MPPCAIPENAPRTLAFALGAWAAGVVLAAASGVFERLPWAVDAALAAFCAACALATYALDAAVRGEVHRIPRPLLAAGGALAIAALAYAAREVLRLEPGAAAALWRLPFALLPFFVLPLGGVLCVAALRAVAAPRLRSSRARSPGASRAAT